MGIWNTVTLDVQVDWDDFHRAHERAIAEERDLQVITVPAEVDLDDALEEATADQLRDALGREEPPGYTEDQICAIRDCFAALAGGDTWTATALLKRVFEHAAQVQAAEAGITHSVRAAA